MPKLERAGGSPLLGEPNFVGAERALAEFRAGRPVLVLGADRALLVLPVDGITDDRLTAFKAFCAPDRPDLVLSGRRALAIGIDGEKPVALRLPEEIDAAAIESLASFARPACRLQHAPACPLADSALALAKLAQRLPAVLAHEIRKDAAEMLSPSILAVTPDALKQFRLLAIRSLRRVSEASVPLNGKIRARFVVFRGIVGTESAAIVVDEPDFSRPVPVRLHSACLTGDVFGSRRCDCGDQLRLALSQLASMGGGIILYLDQEGRGVGLANKMRTYELQDTGLDTVDANVTLGFEDDERDYGVAGRMLEMIGCTKVNLLTNNPAKIDGLSEAGIEIAGRVPLVTPVNGDNRRYLAAKAMRAGHTLDHLFDTIAAPESPMVPDKAEAAT